MVRTLSALFVAAPSAALAAGISVGGVSLEIPGPSGFAPVTPQMATLYEFQKRFVAPSNEEFIGFIPESGTAAALNGELPDLTRRFTVQTAKTLLDASVSRADFLALKETITFQNAAIIQKLEKQLPDLMGNINKGLAKDYDVNLALSISQMVPLPVHEESDKTLSYSSLVSYSMKDASGKDAPFVVVVTATFVHVKGKILFLYSYAEHEGLAWSKDISKQWANAVVAANPGGGPSSLAINWGKVGQNALLGALFGLLAGAVAWLKNRRKAS